MVPIVQVVPLLGSAAKPSSSPLLEWMRLPMKLVSVLDVANATPPTAVLAPAMLLLVTSFD